MTERVAPPAPPATATPPGITEISVAGFKSIRDEQRIAIRPLTLLAGANSSGKSSIIQPLLLLKQTLEATYDPGPLLLNGPNVRFTSADQILARIRNYQAPSFQITLRWAMSSPISIHFERQPGERLRLKELIIRQENEVLVLNSEMSQNEIVKNLPLKLKQGIHNLSKEFIFNIERDRCFLRVKGISNEFGENDSINFTPGSILDRPIRDMIHVPGLRGNPERAYTVAAVGATFPGTFEHYTASVIDKWQEDQEDGDHDKLEGLRLDLERLGLTQQIKANRINDAQVQLQVGRLPHPLNGQPEDLVDISDVGFGVSQTLPVLVALHVARPGQLVYIEQPELHLHPRAQSAMARVLADAALRGVRVVAETHSNLLLLGVQTLVAEGYLPPDLVKLHWFQRGDDGATIVTSADLDETGAYGNWPEDFADVILDAEGRYLDAASARLMSA